MDVRHGREHGEEARKAFEKVIEHSHRISQELYNEVYTSFPEHSVYHGEQWHNFLKDAFGWSVQALFSRDAQGQLELFLPYVSKRGISGKRKASSLPLSHHVPLLAKGNVNVDSEKILSLCGSSLEIKGEMQSGSKAIKSVTTNDLAILDLSSFQDESQLLKAMHKSSIQRKISKAKREGVEVSEESDDAAFEVFYDMEVETRIRQGSPIYPARFFTRLKKAFASGDNVKLFMARVDGKPAAGIIFLFHQDTAIYAYGGSYSNPDWFKLGVNQAAMWEAVRYSFANGYKTLDFGTSPRSQPTLLDYKLKWGAEKVPLATSFVLPEGVEPPVINRDGLAAKLISNGIKKMPKPLFKQLTPTLLKLAV